MKTFDIHTHLGQSIFGYGQSLKELQNKMKEQRVDQALLCPVQPHDYHLPPENDRIAKVVAQYPKQFLGFCRIDPRRQDAKAELQRCIENLQLKGLFLHPWEESCPVNHRKVKALVAHAQKLNIPLMIAGGHVRVSMPSQIADLAREFPQVPMVITSGGQINISGIMLSEATQLLTEHPNLYLETSGIYREDFIEDTLPLIGAERVLFGSNSPEYDLGLEVLRPRLAHLSKAHKAQILSENAYKLLKIKSN